MLISPHHREDESSSRVQDGHRRGRVTRVGEDGINGALGRLLDRRLQSGVDPKTTGEQEPIAILARLAERRVGDEPLLQVVHEVRVVVSAHRRHLVKVDRLLASVSPLGRGDHPELVHEPQDHAPPPHGAAWIRVGVEVSGTGDQPGQECRLREVELLGVDIEERPGGRLHAVRTLAEVDRVQVAREDLVLRQPVFQLPGEHRLAHLAGDRSVGPGVQVLHQLLGDRRAALLDAAVADVHVGGTEDRPTIDPVVEVEATVLDRDGRVADPRGDLGRPKDHAILDRMELCDHPVVRGIDEGRLRELASRNVIQVHATGSREKGAGRHEGRQGEVPAGHRGECTPAS